MSSVWLLLAVVAVIAVAAWLLRRGEGRLRAVVENVPLAEQVDLGLDPRRWSFVEFTAPACAPCVRTRAVLDDVATRVDADVVAVDVAAHVEAARAHSVLRAPTTLVIAPGGHVVARVAGVPEAADLVAATRQAAPAL